MGVWRYEILRWLLPASPSEPPFLFEVRDRLHALGEEGWELATIMERWVVRNFQSPYSSGVHSELVVTMKKKEGGVQPWSYEIAEWWFRDSEDGGLSDHEWLRVREDLDRLGADGLELVSVVERVVAPRALSPSDLHVQVIAFMKMRRNARRYSPTSRQVKQFLPPPNPHG